MTMREVEEMRRYKEASPPRSAERSRDATVCTAVPIGLLDIAAVPPDSGLLQRPSRNVALPSKSSDLVTSPSLTSACHTCLCFH